jgi:hypothetical protein
LIEFYPGSGRWPELFNFVLNTVRMLPVLIASVVLVLAGFFLFSLRLLFVRGGEFRGGCASNNPMLQKEGAVCGVCGRKASDMAGCDQGKTNDPLPLPTPAQAGTPIGKNPA